MDLPAISNAHSNSDKPANRNSNRNQYAIANQCACHIYGDCYAYYRADANGNIFPYPYFHAIPNADHDPRADIAGDGRRPERE